MGREGTSPRRPTRCDRALGRSGGCRDRRGALRRRRSPAAGTHRAPRSRFAGSPGRAPALLPSPTRPQPVAAGARKLRADARPTDHGAGAEEGPTLMERVNVTFGPLQFDHADYDAEEDVLYLHAGYPQVAEGEETPEGRIVRYAPGS